MGYIIVTRNPRNKKLIVIHDENDPAEFPTEQEAIEAAHNTVACQAWGYEIVEVPL